MDSGGFVDLVSVVAGQGGGPGSVEVQFGDGVGGLDPQTAFQLAGATGALQVGDTPASELDLRGYRQRVAFVPQEVILFGGDLRSNIRYGRPDATEEEVIDAAKRAFAWNFIQACSSSAVLISTTCSPKLGIGAPLEV